MRESLVAGLRRIEHVVADETNTIAFLGEELRVFSTPSMVEAVEYACFRLIGEHLDPGETSLGIHVAMDHLGATPIGQRLQLDVIVRSVEGRRVTLDAEVRDAVEVVGRGTHVRMMMQVQRFQNRLNPKREALNRADGLSSSDSGDAQDSPVHPAEPPSNAPVCQRLDGRSAPLHGVDFSGAEERGGKNKKIWIASWYPERHTVELVSGGDGLGFDRRGLARKIIEGCGTWVIDFPFGPPSCIVEAAGWATWHDYLAWSNSNPDPTMLRNDLRSVLQDAGIPWSTKRRVDNETSTTWFPFFEQLYRQTITGARDVLRLLDEAGRHAALVPPFHEFRKPNDQVSTVIEGFPGWTLRQCKLPSREYKGSKRKSRQLRERIIHALRQSGMPISDPDLCRAIHDTQGDAVDALVLLHAARRASRRTAADWRNKVGPQASIEGWFFD